VTNYNTKQFLFVIDPFI